TPALDPAGPGLSSRKAALNEIGRTERSHQRLMQSQACHRQRFFQAFFQAPCRAGADRIEPLHAAAQLFQSFLRRALGPGSAQTPGRLCSLLQGQMLQEKRAQDRKSTRLNYSNITN